MKAPENPFAFPSPDDGRPSDGYGMTLRDWFAGRALTGAAFKSLAPHEAAEAAYQFADAMLTARQTGGDA